MLASMTGVCHAQQCGDDEGISEDPGYAELTLEHHCTGS